MEHAPRPTYDIMIELLKEWLHNCEPKNVVEQERMLRTLKFIKNIEIDGAE